MADKYTNEELHFLIENYPKYGALYCSKKLNRAIGGLYRQCSKLKLNRNHRQKHPSLMNVNIEQFWNINKPEVAYYLGFMWGDGYILNYKCNNIEYHRVALEILSKDAKKIIPIFNKIGKWSIVERQRKNWKPITGIISNNKALYDFLEQNDYKNKSLVSPSKIIQKIPNNLLCYFWRGYFEADGSIGVYTHKKTNKIFNNLKFSGSYNQDWSSLLLLFNKLGITKFSKIKTSAINKLNKLNNYSTIQTQNDESIKKFCDYIYKNYITDKIGIERKYEKWTLMNL